MQLTNEQWQLYVSKYDKLIWTIARRISGDIAIASLEDNYADLCIAALGSIEGFLKKDCAKGKTFEEIFEMKLFDQYTKTVLWNFKAKKGVPLTKKMPFRNKHVSIFQDGKGYDEDLYKIVDIEDKSIGIRESSALLDEIFKTSDKDVKKVLEAIMYNPSVINE